MSHNKTLYWFAFAAVLILGITVALIFFQGVELKNTLYGFFLMTVYILLIASYLSRFALVLFGIFAVYKVLQERVNTSHSAG